MLHHKAFILLLLILIVEHKWVDFSYLLLILYVLGFKNLLIGCFWFFNKEVEFSWKRLSVGRGLRRLSASLIFGPIYFNIKPLFLILSSFTFRIENTILWGFSISSYFFNFIANHFHIFDLFFQRFFENRALLPSKNPVWFISAVDSIDRADNAARFHGFVF